MGIRHTVPAGLPTGVATGKVAGDDWRADHVHVPFEVCMVVLTSATNPAAASATVNTELFSAAKTTRNKIDLSQATQARIVAMPIALGSSTTAAIKLSYMITEASTWSGTDAGPTCVLGNGTAGTLHDGGWTNLATAAKADNMNIALLVSVAFGSTAPTVGNISVFFR